jgi:outer membrane biosynthesis protein TonB
MIPRILVPTDARGPALDRTTQRRRPSTLDERTLVPSALPLVPLDGRTTIPTNLPLEAIASRVLVPRDVNYETVQREEVSDLPAQPTEMDERITIPQGVAPPLELPAVLPVSEDLVEPNIIKTGEVSFLRPERLGRRTPAELARLVGSIAAHILLLLFLIFEPKILGRYQRTREQEEIGRRQISVLLPPGALEALKPSAPPAPHPSVKVDPREIRKVAPTIEPPVVAPPPTPQPEVPKKELPSAPVPQPNVAAPTPQPPAPGSRGDLPKAPQKLETPSMPVPQSGLILPKQSESVGGSIRDAARAAGRPSSPLPLGTNSQLPGGGGGGGGHGGGTAGAGITLLTDTEGVDFNDYLRRVYITVKQNWFAVMPPSVQLGDQGVVSLQFKIMRDGSVPDGDPQRVFGSGKEPLDRAAISSIRASNPFPQLPGQFKGPYIELRFTYYYNLPIPQQ